MRQSSHGCDDIAGVDPTVMRLCCIGLNRVAGTLAETLRRAIRMGSVLLEATSCYHSRLRSMVMKSEDNPSSPSLPNNKKGEDQFFPPAKLFSAHGAVLREADRRAMTSTGKPLDRPISKKSIPFQPTLLIRASHERTSHSPTPPPSMSIAIESLL